MAKRRNDDPSQDNLESQNDADNFGLPDLEYKPLESEEPAAYVEEDQPVAEETHVTSSYEENTHAEEDFSALEEEETSKAPLIISIIIGVVVLVAGFLIYTYVYKPKMEEKARQEQLARELKAKEEEERLARARAEEEEARRRAAEAAEVVTKPAVGEIVTLTERTQRYYVVITSSVDGDLAMDYAKKLSAKGVSTKIIPPFGKWKFYRLAIGDYDTFADAQTSADGSKAEYGDGVWVIKY